MFLCLVSTKYFQAMIRAHLFGVPQLEQWAMRTFASMLETRASSVPKHLLQVANECKECMWCGIVWCGVCDYFRSHVCVSETGGSAVSYAGRQM